MAKFKNRYLLTKTRIWPYKLVKTQSNLCSLLSSISPVLPPVTIKTNPHKIAETKTPLLKNLVFFTGGRLQPTVFLPGKQRNEICHACLTIKVHMDVFLFKENSSESP